jgi:hypothetical protein
LDGQLDEMQSIGPRYRHLDDLGVPYCVTVAFQSLDDDAVTVHERDTMTQERRLERNVFPTSLTVSSHADSYTVTVGVTPWDGLDRAIPRSHHAARIPAGQAHVSLKVLPGAF